MRDQNLLLEDKNPDQPTLLSRFLSEETGAVMIEYVTLLLGVFLTIHITIAPLRAALLDFITDIYIHLTLP